MLAQYGYLYCNGIFDTGLTFRKNFSCEFFLCTETASSSSLSMDNSSIERVNSDQSDEEDTTVSDLSASQFDYV